MLRRFARIPRTRLSMTSRTQLSGTIAAARLRFKYNLCTHELQQRIFELQWGTQN
ncbi:hypothetical protein AG1IA_01121 [Rhizoctonia solani AG-1 IA]|uniref:Uncharacterized protein n=1 Tax=Thanatephorus cucumeris (strain AG1-IA) TaxID=983506 RepID=L8X6Y4_THACA|nr:hypothetical protein AG1IA_01121 [Rhizoctonia solani AG-1 IA]